jgi:hypothetical protein
MLTALILTGGVAAVLGYKVWSLRRELRDSRKDCRRLASDAAAATERADAAASKAKMLLRLLGLFKTGQIEQHQMMQAAAQIQREMRDEVENPFAGLR